MTRTDAYSRADSVVVFHLGGVTEPRLAPASGAGPVSSPFTTQTSASINGLASWVTQTPTDEARRVRVERTHRNVDWPRDAPAQKRARDANRARASVYWPAARRAMAARYPPQGPMAPVRGFERRLEALGGVAQRGVAGQPSQRLLILVHHKAPIGCLKL